MQGPAKIDIALREGYLDTLLVKLGISGAIEVAGDVQTPADIVAVNGSAQRVEGGIVRSI